MVKLLACFVVGLIVFGVLLRLAPLATMTLVLVFVAAFRFGVVAFPEPLRADITALGAGPSFRYSDCVLGAVTHSADESSAIAACLPPSDGQTVFPAAFNIP
ncbi:MAG: hypothetical protein ACLP50_05290 [Solirubrobacteraceae bacterium]